MAPSGDDSSIAAQFRHTRESLAPIVELALDGWRLAIVHGNGPQVGDELLRNELARESASPLPLGVLVASTAGWIGYMVQQSLENALRAAGSDRQVATVITTVEVSAADPALTRPTKFIGHELTAARAKELLDAGETVRKDSRGRLRRVVASPVPTAVHELGTIRNLLESGRIVVCAGGGGIPVTPLPDGAWEGIDAVVDKDLAAAVLARGIGAQLLLILTDVDAVYSGWGGPDQSKFDRLDVATAERLAAAGEFGEGSMAPKVRAAIDFVRRSEGRAIITELGLGRDAVHGLAGTTITAESA